LGIPLDGWGSVASIKRHLFNKSDFDWIGLCQFGNGYNFISVAAFLHYRIDFGLDALFNNLLEGFHDRMEVVPPSD
jgi:hypothetical protein